MSESPTYPRFTRRGAIHGGLAAAFLGPSLAADAPLTDPSALKRSPKAYTMKKSINLWAFPYPQRMSLKECVQLAKTAGFDGIELNFDLENDLSPKATPKDLHAIRRQAEEIGIAISGLCSFLYWPYSLTSNDPALRKRGLELAEAMIRAAHELGTENLLTIAGSTYIPWLPDQPPVSYPDCDQRSREAMKTLIPLAEKLGVNLNVETIWFNGYLTTPEEMNRYVDQFQSERVAVHFDTGNVMLFQFPEDWIARIGKRIRNVHFKEFSKKGSDHTLDGFRTLLDGTTNWPAVMESLAGVGYGGYVTFEYFHPFAHYPEGLIHQSSDALDRILGRKS
jgi:L-ribulose-5-phosphate 3-epimerase